MQLVMKDTLAEARAVRVNPGSPLSISATIVSSTELLNRVQWTQEAPVSESWENLNNGDVKWVAGQVAGFPTGKSTKIQSYQQPSSMGDRISAYRVPESLIPLPVGSNRFSTSLRAGALRSGAHYVFELWVEGSKAALGVLATTTLRVVVNRAPRLRNATAHPTAVSASPITGYALNTSFNMSAPPAGEWADPDGDDDLLPLRFEFGYAA